MQDKKFSVVFPAEFIKSGKETEWRIRGLASTPRKDLQGETIDLKNLDLSPLEAGKGQLNWEHLKGPEHIVGMIDGFKKTKDALYIDGYLFSKHDKAKAIQQIMASLKEENRGAIGLSVEGLVKERGGPDGKTIRRAVITAVALTMNPVNIDTWASLSKSLGNVQEMRINLQEVPQNVHKALGVGSAYASETPGNLSGGDALASEDLDHKTHSASFGKNSEELCADCCAVKSSCTCPKGLKKMSVAEFRKSLESIMFQLSELYPGVPKDTLWDLTRERINHKFPPADL